MREEIKNDKFSLMKELHSLCCCFKAYYMERCYEDLKVMRELCGAHGYWNKAGFDFMLDIKSAHVTLEGDSVVMFQQTARDIFKHLSKMNNGKLAKRDFEYLNDIGSVKDKSLDSPDVTDVDVLLQILKASALLQIQKTSENLEADESIAYHTKWTKLYLIDIVK